MTEAEKTLKNLYAHGCLQVGDVTFAHAHAMVGKVPVLFLPHPVSFGFSHYEWRGFLKDLFPAVFLRED